MLKKIKRLIVMFLLIFVLSTISVNAEKIERVCKYIDTSNKNVYIVIKDNTTTYIYDEDDDVIGVVVSAEKVANGCPQELYKSERKESYPKDKVYDVTAFSSIKNSIYNKLIYKFDGIISDTDVYNGGAYEDGRKYNSDSIKSLIKSSFTCDYKLEDNIELYVRVDTSGSAELIGRKEKIRLINPEEFFNIIEKTRKCPPTICYNKNSFLGAADKVYFYKDIDHTCDISGFGVISNPRNDRQRISNKEVIPVYDKEEVEISDNLIEEHKNLQRSYLQCLNHMDKEDLCLSFYTDYSIKKGNEQILAASMYEKCMTDKYDEDEINNNCLDKKISEKEAKYQIFERCQNSTDPLVKNYCDTIQRKINGIDLGEIDCQTLLGEDLIELINMIFGFVQIIALVILVVLGMIDFTRALLAGDDEGMKKAIKRFRGRLIAVVLLLLLPFLIEFVLNIAGLTEMTNNNPLCKLVR